MDDEQGPWWTRPPEPEPQVPPASARPQARSGRSHATSAPSHVPSARPQGPPAQRRRQAGTGHPTGDDFADEDLFADRTPYPDDDPWVEDHPGVNDHHGVEDDDPWVDDLDPGDEGSRPTAPQPPVQAEIADGIANAQNVEPASGQLATEVHDPGTASAPAEEAQQAPPKPKRPVVRRVAVVPPTTPPRRSAPLDDRTETLPAVSDDIFATFSGPITQTRPDARPAAYEPEPKAPRPQGRPSWLPEVRLPENRMLVLAGAGGLVVLLIVLVALMSGQGQDPATPAARKASPTPAEADRGAVPDGLSELGASDATALLNQAGEQPVGSIVEAWEWKDSNGRNLVVTMVAPAQRGHRTLRVVHVAGLDSDARTLRVMRDPNLPADCRAAGDAGFTPKSMLIRDFDRDDTAEVITGWSSRCGATGTSSRIKLALISGGDKYILRGTGVIGSSASADADPDPRPSRWPGGYLKAVSAQYDKLYG